MLLLGSEVLLLESEVLFLGSEVLFLASEVLFLESEVLFLGSEVLFLVSEMLLLAFFQKPFLKKKSISINYKMAGLLEFNFGAYDNSYIRDYCRVILAPSRVCY